jgi:ArsR family transcriptional regulator
LRNQIPLKSAAECCAPVAGRDITADDAENLATVFRALGDPSRVRIVNLLATGVDPICVCNFTGPLGLSQGTVSFHLKKLLAAGLIEREQRGTWAFYSLRRDVLHRLAGVFELEGAMA